MKTRVSLKYLVNDCRIMNAYNNEIIWQHKKHLIDKTKSGAKVPSLEVVEVVLVQCNLVDNQYQQKSEVLYTFTRNKSYAHLLNVERSNLVLTVTDQNGRPLEIKDKVN